MGWGGYRLLPIPISICPLVSRPINGLKYTVHRFAAWPINALIRIERAIHAEPAERRPATRPEAGAPPVAELEAWIKSHHAGLSRQAPAARAIDYMLKRRDGFARFLDHGRMCLTNNAAHADNRIMPRSGRYRVEAARDRAIEIVFLAVAERAHVRLQFDQKGTLAVPGNCEEIGLVGTIGVGLPERKLRDDARIDRDVAWFQMVVKRERQEESEECVCAPFQLVGRQIPPGIKAIEESGDI